MIPPLLATPVCSGPKSEQENQAVFGGRQYKTLKRPPQLAWHGCHDDAPDTPEAAAGP